MEILLLTLIIILFVLMVFINVYFRVKVIRHYRELKKYNVEFGAGHIFNRQKLDAEVIPRYPGLQEHIYGFTRHLRLTIKMTSVLILLITLLGAVLMYYRH